MGKCINGKDEQNPFRIEDWISANRHHSSIALRRRTVYTLLILFCVMLSPTLAAGEGRGYLGVNGGYKTGDFGTPTQSDLYCFTSDLGYISPTYDLSMTIPYLYLTNETNNQSTTDSGIGDIILRGGLVLVPEGSNGFSLAGSLAMKLPTADETMGLGTGEIDYGIFISLNQHLKKFKLFLMTGFIKIGDPSFQDYNDIYLYGFGISKELGRTGLYTSLEGRRSMFADTEDPLELNFGFFHVLSTKYSVKGSVFFGLNDGGSDLGLSVGFARWF